MRRRLGGSAYRRLQNRPEKSWNEVNSMPTDGADFGVVSGQMRPNGCRATTGSSLCLLVAVEEEDRHPPALFE